MLLTSSGDRARAPLGRSGSGGGSGLTGGGSCSASIPGARFVLGTRRGNPAGVSGVAAAGGGLLASVEGWSARRCRAAVGGGGGQEGYSGRRCRVPADGAGAVGGGGCWRGSAALAGGGCWRGSAALA